jgi:uncharacterized protein (TIGR00730 family)
MPSPIARVCVFTGSRPGARPEYAVAARALGAAIARRGWELVYGGASVGLMGALADAVLEGGGQVTGVIPVGLVEREIAHMKLTRQFVTTSMHERKAKMADLADAFVAMPGGFGTFDELFEIITWAQIALHSKPVGLLDAEGYFAPLVALVDHAIVEGFVPADQRALLVVERDPEALLHALVAYTPPVLGRKWVELPVR